MLDDFFPHIYIYWTTQAMKTRARNDGGNKIKQPNESLYREENVLLCAAFSAAPFLLKTIMKRLLREITAGRTCFSPSYKYTHTHRTAR